MKEILSTIQGVIRLEATPFERMRDDPAGIRKGVLLIVAISLLVSLPGLVGDLTRGSGPFEVAEFEQQFRASIEPGAQFWPEEFRQQFFDNLDAGVRMGAEIAALPTRLPGSLTNVLQALGNFLSHPFSWLGRWLTYLLWVMIFAKLLGGNGGIRQMMAATSLFVLPAVLGFFGFIPILGALLSLIGFVWGAVIYTKGIAVANGLSTSRAALAVVLPIVIAAVLVFGLTLVLGFILVASLLIGLF